MLPCKLVCREHAPAHADEALSTACMFCSPDQPQHSCDIIPKGLQALRCRAFLVDAFIQTLEGC